MKNHSTPPLSPREEGLKFIQTFARLYSPEADNETEARHMARWLSKTPAGKC